MIILESIFLIKPKKPNGIAESFVLAEEFIGNDNICLILGDNIFHGQNLIDKLTMGLKNLDDGYSTIFAKKVKYPQNYGVINFDKLGNVISITEKPKNPNSDLIVSGIYFYTNDVIEIAKNLKLSKRGEKEITDINNNYLEMNKLRLEILGDTISWIDTGTYSSLIAASRYFENFEKKI